MKSQISNISTSFITALFFFLLSVTKFRFVEVEISVRFSLAHSWKATFRGSMVHERDTACFSIGKLCSHYRAACSTNNARGHSRCCFRWTFSIIRAIVAYEANVASLFSSRLQVSFPGPDSAISCHVLRFLWRFCIVRISKCEFSRASLNFYI